MSAPAVHVFEERMLGYRRTYRGSLFASFIQPALFLTAIGIGLGGYVNRGSGVDGVPYSAIGMLPSVVTTSASTARVSGIPATANPVASGSQALPSRKFRWPAQRRAVIALPSA